MITTYPLKPTLSLWSYFSLLISTCWFLGNFPLKREPNLGILSLFTSQLPQLPNSRWSQAVTHFLLCHILITKKTSFIGIARHSLLLVECISCIPWSRDLTGHTPKLERFLRRPICLRQLQYIALWLSFLLRPQLYLLASCQFTERLQCSTTSSTLWVLLVAFCPNPCLPGDSLRSAFPGLIPHRSRARTFQTLEEERAEPQKPRASLGPLLMVPRIRISSTTRENTPLKQHHTHPIATTLLPKTNNYHWPKPFS